MPKIQKLSEEVIKRIAAGEVVERPASVVKELIENAIDAQAQNIKIILENGGKSLIKIIDDGIGIDREDLDIILEPHTTSKIKNLEDIYNIGTLGFRGEALHAISSISKITIKSKTHKQKVAYKLGNYPKFNIVPTTGNIGTTIEVKDLFYNIPARQKFLKSDRTELKHILDIIEAYALAYSKIGFEVIHNGKVILHLPLDQNKEKRFASLLKIDTSSIHLIEHSYFNYKMQALIPNQKIQLENRGYFKIFLNDRYITDNTIKKAVQEALEGFVPKGTKISVLLMLYIPKHLVDVNIHPRKLEVKFQNPYRIYSFIKHSISTNLPKVTHEHFTSTSETLTQLPSLDAYGNAPSNLPNNKPTSTSSLFDKKLDIAYSRLRNKGQTTEYTDINYTEVQTTTPPELRLEDSGHTQSLNINNNNSNKSTQMLITEFQNSSIGNVMQVFNKYLLVEIGSELWVIDQHAAYERIRFEKLKKQNQIKTQTLLEPIKIEIPAAYITLLENELFDYLKKIGFELHLNKNHVQITGIPNILNPNEIVSTFFKALSNVSNAEEAFNEFKSINKSKYELLVATFACHTAIRTGDTLNKEEIKKLVEELLSCEIPTSCPHGRPTIYKLSITDIDKWFLRTY